MCLPLSNSEVAMNGVDFGKRMKSVLTPCPDHRTGIAPQSDSRRTAARNLREQARTPENVAVIEGATDHVPPARGAATDAHLLRKIGRARLSVLIGRSIDAYVSILACPAGAAYVPLDPDYPADRVTFILDDAGVALLLTAPG
jgi:non-ribosomal peptide synthetase component F